MTQAFSLSSDRDAAEIPAVVPGGVHESLLAAGAIGHPYWGQNELDLRWVEDTTWTYRTTISVPADLQVTERLRLRCDALDGVATLLLDDVELGRHVNQHRPAELDLTGTAPGEHELVLRFVPTLASLLAPGEAEAHVEEVFRQRQAIMPGVARPEVDEVAVRLARARIRKATCSWGWDFGARVPSVGVQSDVHVLRERIAVIAGLHVRTTALDLHARTATVSVTVDVDAFAGLPVMIRLTLTSPTGAATTVELPGTPRVETALEVADAQPWWTHDLGDQPLYAVHVQLLHDGDLLDTRSERIGLRTVELDRSADPEGGRLFRLVLNGTPVFSRGANWVPASQLVGSISAETYREAVAIARRGEMNTIRVWGGGIYEPDVFYDACDELGVLVWQDFMFACDEYPSEDDALSAEVALEAAFQVKRLRNHASLAIWAGNNEVEAIHQLTAGSIEPGNWGWSFFHDVLPQAVSTHSPGAVYWPGSPWAEEPSEGINGVLDGDRHAWEVWHGGDFGAGGPTEFETRGETVHFHRYANDLGKFISEFGIHASPELATLERWTPAGSLELRNAAFDHRNKDNPKDKGYALMERETGVPTTLAEYVDFSMACQAEGLKFGVEHYRRRQSHCSGTLVWQLNDIWPGFSWSVVDHDLVPKAGYYFLQRAYRPVFASFRQTSAGLELWVTNSGRVAVDLDLVVEVVSFTGTPAVQEKLQVQSVAGSSSAVWTSVLPAAHQYAWVSSPSGAIEPNRSFFAALKDLPLTGTVTSTATRTGTTTAEVELVSSGYSYFTRILTPQPGVVLDTNYLDLRDGERRVIRVTGLPEGFDVADLQVATFGSRDA